MTRGKTIRVAVTPEDIERGDQNNVDGCPEVNAIVARINAERATEEAALDAEPWPRWRCRIGWHHPVAVRSGTVTGFGFVTRFSCSGRCDAWWLEDDLGRDRQR